MKRPSRRMTISLAVALLCIAVAGVYTWQSLRTWRDYEQRLSVEQRDYSKLRNIAVSAKSPKERIAAIQTLDDKVSNRGNLCSVNGLFAWQAVVFPPIKAGVARCNQKLKQLNTLAKPLHALREYLDATEKLQLSIRSLMPAEGLNESNWSSKGLANAKKLQTAITELKLSGDAAGLQSKAKGLAANLVQSWERLIKANESKDKTAFLTSAASVAASYAEFASLADAADTEIQKKANELIKASSQL